MGAYSPQIKVILLKSQILSMKPIKYETWSNKYITSRTLFQKSTLTLDIKWNFFSNNRPFLFNVHLKEKTIFSEWFYAKRHRYYHHGLWLLHKIQTLPFPPLIFATFSFLISAHSRSVTFFFSLLSREISSTSIVVYSRGIPHQRDKKPFRNSVAYPWPDCSFLNTWCTLGHCFSNLKTNALPINYFSFSSEFFRNIPTLFSSCKLLNQARAVTFRVLRQGRKQPCVPFASGVSDRFQNPNKGVVEK